LAAALPFATKPPKITRAADVWLLRSAVRDEAAKGHPRRGV
jgi:hypothetical protein